MFSVWSRIILDETHSLHTHTEVTDDGTLKFTKTGLDLKSNNLWLLIVCFLSFSPSVILSFATDSTNHVCIGGRSNSNNADYINATFIDVSLLLGSCNVGN